MKESQSQLIILTLTIYTFIRQSPQDLIANYWMMWIE